MRNNHVYLRLFNPSYCDQEFELISPYILDFLKKIDQRYNEINELPKHRIHIAPWKIMTLKLQ